MDQHTFILSDQTENYFGFVVLTAGISLGRFKKNPVCLYNHVDSNNPSDVVGKWTKIRIEELKLLADPELDTEDELAVKLGKKIDKGYIKGASIRLHFKYEDVSLEVEGYKGIPVVTKCEIMEVSIVSIPNNKNAVKLFCDGKEIEDTAVALSLSANQEKPKIEIMKKELIPIFAALSLAFTDNSTEAHAAEAINSLKSDRDSMKLKADNLAAEIVELKAKVAEAHKTKCEALVAKVPADKREALLKLALQDYETTKAIVEGMGEHKTLTEQLNLNTGSAAGGVKNLFEGKTFKQLMATNDGSNYLTKLKAGSTEEKALHKSLWEQDFPNGKYNG